MITLSNGPVVYRNGALSPAGGDVSGRDGTMAYGILQAHNTSGDSADLKIKFDALASHDITYVGIVQTARASGLTEFPLPYVLTNCHNSLCAVGGTINEDDHVFGLSAAKKYGGEFVPTHQAVIHQYMREMYAACGNMILASDSHTRYGAIGSLSIGEGGPELVKQLLGKTYDLAYPEVVAVWLEGSPRPGVGPQDVALAILRETFKIGYVNNKVMEFIGPGIAGLSMDYRNGIDVMTTETTCLSSIWATDEKVEKYLALHGRPDAYRKLSPAEGAYYDAAIYIDLGKIEPMIALPFHPSNAYTIAELKANLSDILAETDRAIAEQFDVKNMISLSSKIKDGELFVDQGIVAGCSGGVFQNILRVNEILKTGSLGDGAFSLSVYPASQPMMMDLSRLGVIAELMGAGAIVRSCFCGPCFGAGDVPANGALSIRHSTRNFPNREGSKPGNGQLSYVALMDARSIAATAANGGKLTSAFELDAPPAEIGADDYRFDDTAYKNRVYSGVGKPDPSVELVLGPGIADWPAMIPLPENLVISVASAIYDPVTTTDELIPSGDTASYRSNPLGLAEFTLSRKDPAYVGRAKAIKALEDERLSGGKPAILGDLDPADTGIGSAVVAIKPGDGSAREQAASCQRVLGGVANIVKEFATKRYRSNVVNWGMVPFVLPNLDEVGIGAEDLIYVKGIGSAIAGGADSVAAELVRTTGERVPLTLLLPAFTEEEREVVLSGCLINFNAK